VAADADDDVVVRRGDTLWDIAARHLDPGATDAEIALDWPRWFSANRSTLGSDPDRLYPGQRLRPPAGSGRHGGPGRHLSDTFGGSGR
jgi:resuscitation-promoting factor RpfA